MNLFVDTSAFVALENTRDSLHTTAVKEFRASLRAGDVLVTSDYVFDETLTLLKRRAGGPAAVAWGRRLLSSALVQMHFIDRATLDPAFAIFERSSDQPFSFTDCTSFALMRERDITTAFAFDDDFTRFGFTLRPRRS